MNKRTEDAVKTLADYIHSVKGMYAVRAALKELVEAMQAPRSIDEQWGGRKPEDAGTPKLTVSKCAVRGGQLMCIVNGPDAAGLWCTLDSGGKYALVSDEDLTPLS